MGGYETEDKRFKMVIADDDGIIGSVMSPNKQRAKEKNPIEYVGTFFKCFHSFLFC